MFLNCCSKSVIQSFRHFYSHKSSRKVSVLGSKYNIFTKNNFYFIIGAFITIRNKIHEVITQMFVYSKLLNISQ
jgi:hypothetical protein